MEERERENLFRNFCDEVSIAVSVLGILVYTYGMPSWNDTSSDEDVSSISATSAIVRLNNNLVPTKEPPKICLSSEPRPRLLPVSGRVFKFPQPDCQGNKLVYQKCY